MTLRALITGSVSDRATSLIRGVGIDVRLTYGSLRVGDPALLVSTSRRAPRRSDKTLAEDSGKWTNKKR